jgi:hypothetical protein
MSEATRVSLALAATIAVFAIAVLIPGCFSESLQDWLFQSETLGFVVFIAIVTIPSLAAYVGCFYLFGYEPDEEN